MIIISESLRDYIERLFFETVRYKDLLSTVQRQRHSMLEAEWRSSWTFFEDKLNETMFCLQLALSELRSMYSDEIGTQPFYVDFPECAIVLGQAPTYPSRKKPPENFADYMDRLYPECGEGPLTINGTHCKDITLQVTDACNMACTYCYQHNKGCHSMSFEVGKEFVDMLLADDERANTYLSLGSSNGFIINFIGGEPLLEIDLITALSDYLVKELFLRKHPNAIKFCLSICSNGLLHFDQRVQEYLRRHGTHLSYNISIDGDQRLHDSCRVDLAGHGTYTRAIAAVRQYRSEFHKEIGSKMTISPDNVSFLKTAVMAMIEEGYRHINLNCVYESGWEIEHARELYWQLHALTDALCEAHLEQEVTLSIFDKGSGHALPDGQNTNWCGGTGLMLAVDWKGNMFPCLRYMESSVGCDQPAFVIGDLTHGINQIEEHCDRIECLACITRRSQSNDECWNCPIASGCGWCSAYNYEQFGTPNKRATYICYMHRARTLANAYYFAKLGVSYTVDCPKEWAIDIIGNAEYCKLLSMQNEVNHDQNYSGAF